jgi:energy-coupling factor transporter ATP-binding protein EcfA2
MKSFDQPLLRLQGVTKVFFTDEVETHALSGIHLEIGKGEFVSIGGPSGCGKSTLLSILGLLDTPTEGTYLLGGKSVADLPAPDRLTMELANRVGRTKWEMLCGKPATKTPGVETGGDGQHPWADISGRDRDHATLRFSAEVLPRLVTSSYSTACPSLRELRPARSTAEMWTKTSLSPVDG